MIIEHQPSIQTINGLINPKELPPGILVLPSEPIFHNFIKGVIRDNVKLGQLTLENLNEVKRNPSSCSSNLVFNDVNEIDTELKFLVNSPASRPILLMDGTSVKNGQSLENLQEISKRHGNTKIVSGFSLFIDKSLLIKDAPEKNRVILNQENLMLKLEDAFFGKGTSAPNRPGFLGELALRDYSLDDEFDCLALATMGAFSMKYRCPFIVSCEGVPFEQLLKYFEAIWKGDQERKYKEVLFITGDSLLDFKEEKDENMVQSKNGRKLVVTHEVDDSYLTKLVGMGFRTILRLGDYSNSVQVLSFIRYFETLATSKEKTSVFLSLGLKYKTQLVKYGGHGFGVLLEDLLRSESIRESMEKSSESMIQALTWWKPINVKPVYEKKWACAFCQNEYPESHVYLSKMGNLFCKPECLKKYFAKK